MTDQEKLAAAEALDRAYAEAEAFDAARDPSRNSRKPQSRRIDAMTLLRKAALDHQGQP
jgi:hypothetical protein